MAEPPAAGRRCRFGAAARSFGSSIHPVRWPPSALHAGASRRPVARSRPSHQLARSLPPPAEERPRLRPHVLRLPKCETRREERERRRKSERPRRRQRERQKSSRSRCQPTDARERSRRPEFFSRGTLQRGLLFRLSLLLVIIGPKCAQAQRIDWNSVAVSPSLPNTQTELATCECDLTYALCDANCCCDPDCPPTGAAQSALFSGSCLPEGPQAPRRPYCSSSLVRTNLRRTETGAQSPAAYYSENGVLCIMFDNVPGENLYFSAPNLVGDLAAFSGLYARAVTSAASTYTIGPFTQLNKPIPPLSAYKAGSPIQLRFSSSLRGYLPLPMATVSGACMDDVPAQFLAKATRSCIRTFGDIQSACAQGGPLDWVFYLGGYGVISDPSLSTPTTIGPAVATPLCQDPGTLEMTACCVVLDTKTLAACGSQGASSDFSNLLSWDSLDLPRPALGSDGICNQAVIGVSYEFTIVQPAVDASGVTTAATIDGVEITLTYGAVRNFAPTAPVSVMQTFAESYISTGADAASVFSRSGAPGYNLGSPVLFGSLVTNSGKKAIQVLQEPFTLTGSHPVTGACLEDSPSDRALRTPITFGQDTATGCVMTLSRADLASCGDVRRRVLRAQLGAQAAAGFAGDGGLYAGMWGASDVGNVAEWVKVLGADQTPALAAVSNEPAGAFGTCDGLLTELSVEFLWADTGSLAYPQATIVGARVVTAATGSFAPACGGGSLDACRDGSSPAFTFFVRSAVTFARSPATAVEEVWPSPPSVGALLPSDVFYPFMMSAASRAVPAGWGSEVAAVAAAAAALGTFG